MPFGSDIRPRRVDGTNIISLKLKVSITLLIYQKYHSNEVGISLKRVDASGFEADLNYGF